MGGALGRALQEGALGYMAFRDIGRRRVATCAWGPREQNALGKAAAQARELGGALEELHNLLQLGLGLGAALDVLERHPAHLRHVLLRAAACRATLAITRVE